MLDLKGNIINWNAGAQRIKGYKANEIIGRHFSQFYPNEARESRWPERELEIAAQQGRFVDEGLRIRKDGSSFWAYVVITALRDERGELRGFSKVTRDLSERRALEERQLETTMAGLRLALSEEGLAAAFAAGHPMSALQEKASPSTICGQ